MDIGEKREYLEEQFCAADTNGDGVVDFAEFVAYYAMARHASASRSSLTLTLTLTLTLALTLTLTLTPTLALAPALALTFTRRVTPPPSRSSSRSVVRAPRSSDASASSASKRTWRPTPSLPAAPLETSPSCARRGCYNGRATR